MSDVFVPSYNLGTCIYCASNNSKSPDELLRCGKCHRLAHSICLRSGLPPGQLKGDNFFEFTCQSCAKVGTDIVLRANLSVTHLLLLTLYNLHMKNPLGHRKGLFHWKLHIYKFISQHWNDLFQGNGLRKKKRSLQGTLLAHLSHYPDFFVGGHDLNNDGGWYKLCQVLPPAVLLHQEAQMDINTNLGGPTNKKARFEEGNPMDRFTVEEIYVKEEVAELPLDESSCGSWYLERDIYKPQSSLPNSIFEDDYEEEEVEVKEEIKIEEEDLEDSKEDIDFGQIDVIDSDLTSPSGVVSVSELQQLKFSQLSLCEKMTVKKRGRSTPDIQISQPGISNNKKYIRSFNSDWYQRKSWLCGCEVKNALFCFPCLLLGGEVTWTKDGFRNINKMKEKTEKHEKSKKHIENVVSLSLLGNINIKAKFSKEKTFNQ
ncbi:uncharacterized protein LOC143028461 [Oratosquilla oratoria]|uniref:uncharacterized protein LOC143028461 n=1 Tax=Oratosquilla oratoria TaxID=337810 RepID=UPI003F76749C